MVRDMSKLAALEGLIPDELGERLYEMAKDVHSENAIVEIGAYHGKSTAYLAAGATDGNKARVYSVDPWSEDESDWRRAVADKLPSPEFEKWDAQLRSVRLRSKVEAIQATSLEGSKQYEGSPIGLLYIDGNHSEHSAAVDLLVWAKHLAPGAVVAWDDYGTPGNPGVEAAVKRLVSNGTIVDLEVFDRLAVARYAGKPVKLSVAIMAHPVRAKEVEELVASLDREVTIIFDERPQPSKDPKQRWTTGKRAWQAYDPDADWHMVIQDDAIVCPDMIAGFETALAQFDGEGIVSAYTGTGRPDQNNVKRAIKNSDRFGHRWLTTWSLNWGVAFAVPTNTIDEMLAWCDRPARAQRNYDMRIGQYYRDIKGWKAWHTYPSLVDHRDTASLVGHGQGGNRHAHNPLHTSALDVDWSRHDGLEIEVPEHAKRPHPA
jgi:predicted O-methyltransferase YrrM